MENLLANSLLFDLTVMIAIPAICLAFSALVWLLIGRDPSAQGTVVPTTERLQDFSVLEAGLLLDDLLQDQDLVYQLLDFSWRGILKLEKGELGFRATLKDTLENIAPKVNQTELLILSTLFETNTGALLTSEVFKQRKVALREKLEELMVAKGYYSTTPSTVPSLFYTMASLMLMGAIGANPAILATSLDSRVSEIQLIPWLWLLGLFIAGIIMGYFGTAMAKKTPLGMKKITELNGLKMFIVTAEKDRIETMARESIEHYRSILPYAFLFGVQDRWLPESSKLEASLLPENIKAITGTIDDQLFQTFFERRRFSPMALVNIFLFTMWHVLRIAFYALSRGRRNS